jgi:hypothetical protein
MVDLCQWYALVVTCGSCLSLAWLPRLAFLVLRMSTYGARAQSPESAHSGCCQEWRVAGVAAHQRAIAKYRPASCEV